MRLLLAPHAPTEWNAQRRYQGHVDIPLSTVGRRQAALLAEFLVTESFDEIHVSDLRRAVETAEAVAAHRGMTLRLDGRLRELRFGAWEGLTFEEVCQRFPEMKRNWETNVPRIAPLNGETLPQLAERIGAYLSELIKAVSLTKTLLVVAHRGSLQVLLCLALGLPPDAWWKFRLEPASLSEVRLIPEGAVLVSFNGTHHLRETIDAR